jgi:hypothetical protein
MPRGSVWLGQCTDSEACVASHDGVPSYCSHLALTTLFVPLDGIEDWSLSWSGETAAMVDFERGPVDLGWGCTDFEKASKVGSPRPVPPERRIVVREGMPGRSKAWSAGCVQLSWIVGSEATTVSSKAEKQIQICGTECTADIETLWSGALCTVCASMSRALETCILINAATVQGLAGIEVLSTCKSA